MKTKVDTSKFVYKDMFGHDIKVGDYIVYAALADRSGVLRAGRVLELTHSKPRWPDEVVEPKVKAESWNNYRSQNVPWNNPAAEISGKQKSVTLGFLDRLIVVPESIVSAKVKADLDGPETDWQGLPLEK